MKKHFYFQLPVTVEWDTSFLLGRDDDQNISTTSGSNTAVDWQHLSVSKEPQDREVVPEADMHEASKSFIDSVRTLIEQELYVLTVDARKAADAFWQMNKKMRATDDPKLQGFFGTRARIVKNSLDATWYKNRFITNKVTGSTRVLSDHVAKGKGYRYPVISFKTAKEWEKAAIKVAEDRYAPLRQRSATLTKIRRAVAEYERLVDQCFPRS